MDVVRLTLAAIAILILGALSLWIGPDLWVLLNAWMQQAPTRA